ncbi:hypothetical protein MRX96_020484 [Rhipicephalus microplus]
MASTTGEMDSSAKDLQATLGASSRSDEQEIAACEDAGFATDNTGWKVVTSLKTKKKERAETTATLIQQENDPSSGQGPGQLSPDLPRPDIVFQKDAVAKKRQTLDLNRRHGARKLRDLSSGDELWVTDVKCRAQVLSRGQRPQSYIVETPSGVIQRNQRHLVHYSPDLSVSTPVSFPSPGPNQEQRLDQEEPSHGQQHDTSTGADPDSIPHQVTRSGRRVVPPKRLNL